MKTSEAIRPVQTAVKVKRTYSYSRHHAARKRVSSFDRGFGFEFRF